MITLNKDAKLKQ